MLKALRMVRKSYIAVTRFKINTDLKKKVDSSSLQHVGPVYVFWTKHEVFHATQSA